MDKLKIGFAITGSFCTHERALNAMRDLKEKGHDLLPIFSFNVANTDTRFGNAKEFRKKVEEITGKEVVDTIVKAEPIGPKDLVDVLVVVPCTGNTMAKLANAITDTPVTMAVKSHIRNDKPVVIAMATNDALGASLNNIATLMSTKNFYFVPFGQDDPEKKPKSMVANFEKLYDTILLAMQGKQIQPILFAK